jgi:phosphoesterase RecJ-like protein
MFEAIYKKIQEYETIVIARHIGVDPDALASQLALRETINLTFPDKKVYAVGTGSQKFNYFGKLDKLGEVNKALLIVCDTPDKKRIDGVSLDMFSYIIKIDHHPFIEKYADLEYIEDGACSTCQILMDMLLNTKLECNKEIAETLYMGLVADSNRFLFDNATPKTFALVSTYLDKYHFCLSELYNKMYARDLNEVRLEGYIASNMKVTKNGLGYIKITDEIINKFKVDSAAAGNMVNNFNFIKEVKVWATITEDVKNKQIRVSIRSRGPVINKIAENYNGGGHKLAAGAKTKTFTEAMKLMKEIDNSLKEENKEE